MPQTLGTQLRHLIELLDDAVQEAYTEAGIDYRPRYTPVMRALIAEEPLTIGEIAERAGLTQPAATQTVGLMCKKGLVRVAICDKDARRKEVHLSSSTRKLIPELELCWCATASAARSLEAELPHSLTETLAVAISALQKRSFGDRIRSARANFHGEQRSARRPPSPKIVQKDSGTRRRKKRVS